MKSTRVHRHALLGVLCGLLLSGCASTPPAASTEQLFDDALFAAPSQPVDLATVFTLSEPMRAYAATELAPGPVARDPRRALMEALYSKGHLQLDYENSSTRNAAEAFEARAGNCLSLVIMTAAFAKHLGLPYTYQSVLTDDFYSRAQGLTLASGHVNLVLGELPTRTMAQERGGDLLVVDFLRPEEARSQRAQPLPERRLLAMYANNRAAEVLAQGRLADAYAWAQAAVRQDPGFVAAANTLGVVYSWAGHTAHAERALRHVLAADDTSTSALTNLARLLEHSGRHDEAREVSARLARVQPEPPFKSFNLGRLAMDAGNWKAARDLFARELRLQPYQPEVHHWAAVADWLLGDAEGARRHLELALENSLTRASQERYAAKLEGLRDRDRQRLQ
jgi:tetratricopeptide (TPR) repeat protein